MSEAEGPRMPTKPMVPTVFYLALGIFAAAAVWLRWEEAWKVATGMSPPGAIVPPVVAAVCAAVGVWLLLTLVRPAFSRVVLVLVAGLAAGSLAAWLALSQGVGVVRTLSHAPVSSVSVVPESEATHSRYGYRCRASLASEWGTTGQVWVSSDEPLETGRRYACVGRFETDEGDWAVSSRAQGVWGTVRVRHVMGSEPLDGPAGALARLSQTAYDSLDPASSDARAIAAACVCGRRSALRDRGVDKSVAACGVSHLVAVSGTHIAVVLSLVGGLLARSRMARPLRFGVLLLVGGAFVAFCGAPASAVRALLMTMCAIGSDLLGRRSQSLAVLSVAASGMMLFDPCVTGQLGFCLSVVCVAALTTLSPYVGYAIDVAVPRPAFVVVPRKPRRRLRKASAELRRLLSASVTAQLATAPLTASTFGVLSLVGPLANLVVSAPFVVALQAALVSCLLAPVPPLHAVALAVVDIVGVPLAAALRTFASLPLAAIPVELDPVPIAVGVIAVAMALLVVWPRLAPVPLRCVLVLVVLVIAGTLARWCVFEPPGVTVLDVGQGDAILVRDGPFAVLVDAGPDDAVVSALARNHVYHLDAVVVTHLHDDHYGGLRELEGVVAVDEVYVARGVTSGSMGEAGEIMRAACGREPVELGLGDSLRVGAFDLSVVWPQASVDGHDNADSIMMDVEYHEGGHDMRALLTGDAERDECAHIAQAVGDIDFLKVGHHGSEVSITPEEARALDAEVAVASAGEGNKYGHPTDECVSILERSGALFICTKDAGDVLVQPGEGGVVVSSSRGSPVL